MSSLSAAQKPRIDPARHAFLASVIGDDPVDSVAGPLIPNTEYVVNNSKEQRPDDPESIGRRRMLGATGGGLMATLLSNVWPVSALGKDKPVIQVAIM